MSKKLNFSDLLPTKKIVLEAPLVQESKPALQRAERAVAYEKSTQNISKWLPVIVHNRRRQNIQFPLNEDLHGPQSSLETHASSFIPESNLELDMQAVLESQEPLFHDPLPETENQKAKKKKLYNFEEKNQRANILDALSARAKMKALPGMSGETVKVALADSELAVDAVIMETPDQTIKTLQQLNPNIRNPDRSRGSARHDEFYVVNSDHLSPEQGKKKGINPWIEAAKEVVELEKDINKNVKKSRGKVSEASTKIDSTFAIIENETLDLKNQNDQSDLIREAFVDDNVFDDEFAKMKEKVQNEETQKDEDITLPGWGHWAGTGLAPTKRRLIKKAPPQDPRKDKFMSHVIISAKRPKVNEKMREVGTASTLKKENAATLYGPQFNTYASYRNKIKPSLSVRKGTVIRPMGISKMVSEAHRNLSTKNTIALRKLKKSPTA